MPEFPQKESEIIALALNKTGDLSAPACRGYEADRCGHAQAGSEPGNTVMAVL